MRIVSAIVSFAIASYLMSSVVLAENDTGSRNSAAGTDMPSLESIARKAAESADVPYELVAAVIKIESDYRPRQVGDVGEIGLMQVRPGTAAMLGFRGSTDDLFDPTVNIHYGTTYLAQAWHVTNGNVCRTLMKYRAGQGENFMSARSVSYCERARAYLATLHSPLVASISSSELVVSKATAPSPRAARNGISEVAPGTVIHVTKWPKSDKAFWALFEARIKKMNAVIEAKWRHMAAYGGGRSPARGG